VTQVEPYSPRRARRTAGGSAPGEALPGSPGPSGDSYRPDGSTPEHRRGSHATRKGQGFSWVLVWTMIGALIPGAGLIAAGWKRIGTVVLLVLGLSGVAVIGWVLLGHPVQYVIGLAVDPKRLLLLAGFIVFMALAWAVVILLTNTELRRSASLTGGQSAFAWLVVVALVVAVAVPAYSLSHVALVQRGLVSTVFSSSQQDARSGTVGPKASAPDPWAGVKRENVLLIGSDAGADRIGVRPDSMILASINPKTGDTVLFSMPRNLQRTPFPLGTGAHQAFPDGFYCPGVSLQAACLLNAIWTTFNGADYKKYYPNSKNPGLEATEDAVEGATGLHVDNYLMLNLNGFRDFVNAIGGVTVNVTEKLPIGGNVEDPGATIGYILPGKHKHLNGFDALWFARSRWSTDDYDRMRRQRCMIGALTEQTNPVTVFKAFPQIAATLKTNLSTSIPQKDLAAWLTLAERIKNNKVRSLPFTDQVINTSAPNFAKMHRLVEAALNPPAVTATPTPSASASGTTKKTKAKKLNLDQAQNVDQVC
jgi:LCP family protein required for cell wall assembly